MKKITGKQLKKYWDIAPICIVFSDGSDALAQENGYTLEQCMGMKDAIFFLDIADKNVPMYECSINKDKILEAIKNHSCYDNWGEVEYRNGSKGVTYNICVDSTTENTAYLSAFYRCSKGRDGYWYDECHEWYSYEINFSDDNWIEKLKEAAEKAYEALWEE